MGLKSSPFWVELLFVIRVYCDSHGVSCLVTFEAERTGFSLSIVGVVFEATRAPNTDILVIFVIGKKWNPKFLLLFFLHTLCLQKYSLKLCVCILFMYV
jgi:hypothetical protein